MQEIDYDHLIVDENHCYSFDGHPFTGLARKRSPEGVVIADVPFVDGAKHGVVKEWYPSGQFKQSVPYRNNMPHGQWVEQSQNGKLLLEAEYEYGVCLWRKKYDQNGRLTENYNIESDETSQISLRIARQVYSG